MSKDYNKVVKEMREASLNMIRLNVTENYY
jgi:hypothetical protein